jgi:antitoxin component YwqK of YwqJK toxin-antitoxin module
VLAPILSASILLCAACQKADPAKGVSDSQATKSQTPDWENPEALKAIIADAALLGSLDKAIVDGERLQFEPDSEVPYTGWKKKLHDNGHVAALAQYKAGKPEGAIIEWREDGTKESVSHRGTRGITATTSWYPNGNKKLESSRTGEPEERLTKWFENGQKAKEITLNEGVLEGPFTYWHENGQKSQHGTFKAGKLEGSLATWHDNGERAVESFYKDGKLEGMGSSWNRDGTLWERVEFRDGQRVE